MSCVTWRGEGGLLSNVPFIGTLAGDNEPWTLVNSTDNYNAIGAAIRFRDQLRNYVVDTQATWVSTNAPMIAPIWLLFPGDPICAFTPSGDEPACGEGMSEICSRLCHLPVCQLLLYPSAEFMFGPDYLAKPVTTYLQRSAWVYLPELPTGQTWIYHFNDTDFGSGPVNLTIATPVGEFPLFYRNSLGSRRAETRW